MANTNLAAAFMHVRHGRSRLFGWHEKCGSKPQRFNSQTTPLELRIQLQGTHRPEAPLRDMIQANPAPHPASTVAWL
jgi:hypothetical protein